MSAIVVQDLHRSYGDTRAVTGVSFEVDHGEVFALVGPAGAGKTTTLEILEGQRPRCSGAVSVLGFDPATAGRTYRERIGVVLPGSGLDERLTRLDQEFTEHDQELTTLDRELAALDREFTTLELIRLRARSHPRPQPVDDVIQLVGLEEQRETCVKALSEGQRRRLDVALGLLGDPEVLFLDEPTTESDPDARSRVWEVVGNLRSLGKTIVLATDSMEEAVKLADRVGVMAAGKLVALGTPWELANRHRNGDGDAGLIRFRLPAGVGAGNLPDLGGQLMICPDRSIEVRSVCPTRTMQVLTAWAQHYRIDLEEVTLTPPNLEAAYRELLGQVAAASHG